VRIHNLPCLLLPPRLLVSPSSFAEFVSSSSKSSSADSYSMIISSSSMVIIESLAVLFF